MITVRHLPFLLPALVAACAAAPTAISPNSSLAYVEALGTAHAFLDAWVARDADAGVQLMATSLRRGPSGSDPKDHESWLRLYVQGLSNPHHSAFELAHGTLPSPTRAIFPVTLYEGVTREPAFGYSSSIELVREADSWRVSILPKSSDNYEY